MGQKQAGYDAQRNVIGFYDDIDSPAPAGVPVVDITDPQWTFLLEGQTNGKRMAFDAQGSPVLLDPLPPTRAEAAVTKRAVRDVALSSTDWLVSRHQDEKLIGDGTTLTADQFAELLKYRQALRDIGDADGWPYLELPTIPDFVDVPR